MSFVLVLVCRAQDSGVFDFFIEIFFMLAIIPFELRCVLLLSLLSSVESICQFVIAGRNVFILVG